VAGLKQIEDLARKMRQTLQSLEWAGGTVPASRHAPRGGPLAGCGWLSLL